jgi:hypothetical protein
MAHETDKSVQTHNANRTGTMCINRSNGIDDARAHRTTMREVYNNSVQSGHHTCGSILRIKLRASPEKHGCHRKLHLKHTLNNTVSASCITIWTTSYFPTTSLPSPWINPAKQSPIMESTHTGRMVEQSGASDYYERPHAQCSSTPIGDGRQRLPTTYGPMRYVWPIRCIISLQAWTDNHLRSKHSPGTKSNSTPATGDILDDPRMNWTSDLQPDSKSINGPNAPKSASIWDHHH